MRVLYQIDDHSAARCMPTTAVGDAILPYHGSVGRAEEYKDLEVAVAGVFLCLLHVEYDLR